MLDVPAAEKHLAKIDPVMRTLIRTLGPCTLRRLRGLTPYQSLVRAVAHQQLHATAAERILARLVALTPGPHFPLPEELAAMSEEQLRGVGFSNAKARSLKDIAQKTVERVIPDARALARLSDETVIERLTAVRGVGRWTAEILLMRSARPDVLPADDFGLRSGLRAAYELKELPSARDLRTFGERWSPHRTVASWYLWRAADRAKEQLKPKTPASPKPKKPPARATKPAR